MLTYTIMLTTNDITMEKSSLENTDLKYMYDNPDTRLRNIDRIPGLRKHCLKLGAVFVSLRIRNMFKDMTTVELTIIPMM